MIDWTQAITLIIGVLGASGSIVALFQIRASKRKLESEARHTDAQTGETVANTAIRVMNDTVLAYEKRFTDLEGQYETRFTDMESSLEELNAKVLELHLLVQKFTYFGTCLINQIIKLKQKPVVTLDDIEKYSVEQWKRLAER